MNLQAILAQNQIPAPRTCIVILKFDHLFRKQLCRIFGGVITSFEHKLFVKGWLVFVFNNFCPTLLAKTFYLYHWPSVEWLLKVWYTV
jgi:hypothetical protein